MRVVHCKREPFDVYIGRPSRWGNPYSHRLGTLAGTLCASREEAIERYGIMLRTRPDLLVDLSGIAGKTLGCWCSPKPCHGDVIIRVCREMGLIE